MTIEMNTYDNRDLFQKPLSTASLVIIIKLKDIFAIMADETFKHYQWFIL